MKEDVVTDETQTYDTIVTAEAITVCDVDKQPLTAAESQGNEAVVGETRRERHSTESSTQTIPKPADDAFESLDVNVVQKVAEYLQSGYGPGSRSRTSSTCTDISDPHPEGSEKGEILLKTPVGKAKRERVRTPSGRTSRMGSTDSVAKKSPQEIRDIVQTYSSILSKRHHKHKSINPQDTHTGSPTSHRPNITDEHMDSAGKLMIARRLSTQSLPDELLRSKDHQAASLSQTPRRLTGMFEPMSKFPEMHIKTNSETIATVSLPKSNNSSPVKTDDDVKRLGKRDAVALSLSNKLNTAGIEKAGTDMTGMKTPSKTDVKSVSEESSKESYEIKEQVRHVVQPTGIENKDFVGVSLSKTGSVQKISLDSSRAKTVNIEKETTPRSSRKLTSVKLLSETRSKLVKQRNKKLLSAQKRNARRKSKDSLSPQMTSGSFLAGTQKFTEAEMEAKDAVDPYKFVGSQSQLSPKVRNLVIAKKQPLFSSLNIYFDSCFPPV